MTDTLRVVMEGKIEGSPTVMADNAVPQEKDSTGDSRGYVILKDCTGRMYIMQRGDTITVR